MATSNGEFEHARQYWVLAAKLQRRAQEGDAEESTRVRIAMSYKDEAQAVEEQSHSLTAHHHWGQAIKAFRERSSLRDQVPTLHVHMAAAGRKTLELMPNDRSTMDALKTIYLQLEMNEEYDKMKEKLNN